MDFLKKLDLLIEKKGLKNRKDLAEKSGIPYTTIMSFYNRGYENVTLPTLRKLSEFLDCTLDYLVDDSVLEPNKHFSPDKAYLEPDYNKLQTINDEQYPELNSALFKMLDGYTVDDLSEEDKQLLEATIKSIKKNIDKQEDKE